MLSLCIVTHSSIIDAVDSFNSIISLSDIREAENKFLALTKISTLFFKLTFDCIQFL